MDTDAPEAARLVRWDDIEDERITDAIGRRFVTGERMMLARLQLDEGAVVPMHSHPNEQLSYVLDGTLKFVLGGADGEEVVVRAGEVLLVPAGLPHAVEALEDTLDVDVFSPPRQDWIDGSDGYFQDEDS